MKKLKLGIPKGSLEANTIDLFKRAGWRITYDSRSYFPDIDDVDISCSLVRAQEMSRYIEEGVLDLGLTGHDWIVENESDVQVIQDLVYSKVSAVQARWVLVVRDNSRIKSLKDLEGKRVSTELVNFTKRYFKKHNINVEVEFSWGATEAKVVEGVVDAIVEVTETGSTLRQTAQDRARAHENQYPADCQQGGMGRSMEKEKDRTDPDSAERIAPGSGQGGDQAECAQESPNPGHSASSVSESADYIRALQ